MRDAGLELELAITQDRCLTRLPSYSARGTAAPVQSRSLRPGGSDGPGGEYVGGGAPARAGAGPRFTSGTLLAELGVIGVPGAPELPSFVAVEITKEIPPLPASVPKASRPRSMTRPVAGGARTRS